MELLLSLSPFGREHLARGVELARLATCAGVEVSADLLDKDGPPAALANTRIRVLAIGWRPDRRPDIAAFLALADRLGSRAVNIYGTLPAGHDALAARRLFVADVEAALAKTPARIPVLLLENELAAAPGFSAGFDVWLGILRQVDSTRFRGTLDAANFVAAGDGQAIERTVREAAPWIWHVHAKCVVPFDPALHEREPFRRMWEAKGKWLAAPAGEGLPDWKALLARLIDNGYGGAVTVEPFQEEQPILKAVSFLRHIIRAGDHRA
jgi:sugar phosphate isomerase/epimerase